MLCLGSSPWAIFYRQKERLIVGFPFSQSSQSCSAYCLNVWKSCLISFIWFSNCLWQVDWSCTSQRQKPTKDGFLRKSYFSPFYYSLARAPYLQRRLETLRFFWVVIWSVKKSGKSRFWVRVSIICHNCIVVRSLTSIVSPWVEGQSLPHFNSLWRAWCSCRAQEK